MPVAFLARITAHGSNGFSAFPAPGVGVKFDSDTSGPARAIALHQSLVAIAGKSVLHSLPTDPGEGEDVSLALNSDPD